MHRVPALSVSPAQAILYRRPYHESGYSTFWRQAYPTTGQRHSQHVQHGTRVPLSEKSENALLDDPRASHASNIRVDL